MRNLLGILALLIFVPWSYAQSVVPPNVRATHTLDKLTDLDGINTSDILYGIPLPPGKIVGDTYLDIHWRKSSILLYENDKLIEGFPLRYDIQANEAEIKSKSGIKVLKGEKIKSFVWVDSLSRTPDYFVNAKDFRNEDNVPYTGFFQVLTEGPVPLFKKTLLEIKKADYNVQFNVGSQDDKILKKSKYYAFKDTRVLELPSSRKRLAAFFGDKAESMEAFMRDNNLSPKGDELKIIFDHYNSLVTNQTEEPAPGK